MQVAVWIIIILVILFLIWLLRKWIKRIIFILILLVLAFFIYGIFNPSGAARLWYNVRTFPQRMAGRMGSTKEFLDYDSYKSKISSVGENLDLDVEDIISQDKDDSIDEDDFDSKADIQNKSKKDKVKEDAYDENESDNLKVEMDNNDTENEDKIRVKAFPKNIKFIEMPDLKGKHESEDVILTGYSKSDLLGVINKYIEKNLDDDTDILVTVEYQDDDTVPQKIILQTQPKKAGSSYDSESVLNDVTQTYNSDVMVVSSSDLSAGNGSKTQSVQKTTSNRLTQKEQKEAEELFSVLF